MSIKKSGAVLAAVANFAFAEEPIQMTMDKYLPSMSKTVFGVEPTLLAPARIMESWMHFFHHGLFITTGNEKLAQLGAHALPFIMALSLGGITLFLYNWKSEENPKNRTLLQRLKSAIIPLGINAIPVVSSFLYAFHFIPWPKG